jgi:anti-anti-sigma factor
MSTAPHVTRSPDWINRAAIAAVQALDCVVVTADGEVDAANADALATYALEHLGESKSLIVDLTMLNFFGIEGFSALHTLNVQCAGVGVRWAVAASGAVTRVLRICDPAGALPAATTLDAAKRLVHGDQAPLLQLVAQPR